MNRNATIAIVVIAIILIVVIILGVVLFVYIPQKTFVDGDVITITARDESMLSVCQQTNTASFASEDELGDSEVSWKITIAPDNVSFCLMNVNNEKYLSIDDEDNATMTPMPSDFSASKSSWFLPEYADMHGNFYLKSLYNTKYVSESVTKNECNQNVIIFAANRKEIYPLNIKIKK